MTRFLVRTLMSAALASTAIISTLAPITAHAALPVFDPTNYAQNLLQAARALQQINQQIQQLQNEAQMIAGMKANLAKLGFSAIPQLTSTLRKIDGLMAQARGIDFRVSGLDAQFKQLFPQMSLSNPTTGNVLTSARARLDEVMATFRQTMGVQAQVVENVQGDAQLLSTLVDKSQNAAGALEAQQATNQLLALTAKQQFQLQTMMAAQFRSQSMEAAARAQAESDARAATKRFLGSGRAYRPQ